MKQLKTIMAAVCLLTGGMLMAMSEKDKTLVAVAAETARGDLAALESAYGAALAAGWTVQELKEVGTQAYAYCGFPKSLNSLGTLMKVAPEKSGGANPSRPDGDSLTRGTKVQTELCGGPVKGALFDFAPAIDDYLKAHLFGDIFGRGILTWRQREVATVAMLAALGNVKPQLDAHIGIAKRNGVSDNEIKEILALVNNETTVSDFELGEPNPYKQFFSGRSWLKKLTAREEELGVPVYNVTFEPGCRNNWHKHTGGQMLIGVGASVIIRRVARRRSRSSPVRSSRFPPMSSTGTVPRRTAGSRILRSRRIPRRTRTPGSNPSRTRTTRRPRNDWNSTRHDLSHF